IRVPPTKPFRRVSTDRVQRNRSNSCGFIRSATRRVRHIPLYDSAVAALQEQAKHTRKFGRFVFCDRQGNMLTRGACKWPLWRACDRAGVVRVRWHVLRHTFASHLVMRGVPVRVVQEILGHVSILTTQMHAHLAPSATLDAVRVLDAA
ncbi:MAG: site-specific integrase, partial [Polyangiaceae bacterium]|nr:site-specific integrase [Polyangiaceae bacterium]